MALNLNNGGDFTPHIRFLASTSSWTQSSEGGQQAFQFSQAIFDLDNIQTGWNYIAEGEAPEWVLDPTISQMAPKPQDGREWKRGFKINVYSASMFGTEPVRELASSGTGVVMGITALYDQFEKERGTNAGLVPVVEYAGAVHTKVGKGNTSVPTLKIVKWVARPAALSGDAPVAAPTPVAAAAPVAATGVSEF
jgi:hypothetical protein